MKIHVSRNILKLAASNYISWLLGEIIFILVQMRMISSIARRLKIKMTPLYYEPLVLDSKGLGHSVS